MRVVQLITDNREAFKEWTSPFPYFGTAPTALLEGFTDLPNVEIHVISCTRQPMSSPAKLANNIWFHSLYVPKGSGLRTAYAGCILAVRKKLSEIRPNIIHSQGTERDCAISAVFSRIPKVLTIHGNIRAISKLHKCAPFSFWWLQARLEKFCLPRFHGVICISRYTEQLVSSLAKTTWLLPNATEASFFDAGKSRAQSNPMDPASILVVANVDSRKNQVGLIHALDELCKRKRFQLRFFGKCGDDAYGLEFQKLIRDRSWCFFGGMISRDQLRKEFMRATALILPTREDNCPMVILEAQASRLPVIASKVGGVPDLIEDGVTGFLTDPDCPETMPQALEKLLGNKALANQISEQAQEQALARFHPRVIASRHLAIYREVLTICS
jgi:glycosyltransferase involved in cell wall biosynthesis